MFRPLLRRGSPAARLMRQQPLSVRLLAIQLQQHAPVTTSKIFTPEDAVKDIQPGSTVLSSGFGLCGTPDTLIDAISRNPQIQKLTCVSNNAGSGELGLGE